MVQMAAVGEGALTDYERQLAILLSKARVALWREWVEAGSEEAKAAHDATDPTETAEPDDRDAVIRAALTGKTSVYHDYQVGRFYVVGQTGRKWFVTDDEMLVLDQPSGGMS